MTLTPAERQRRSRAHRRGDHSLCDLDRCDGVTVTPPKAVTRGDRLYQEMTSRGSLSPTQTVLLEEARRLVDRIDCLEQLLAGDARDWLELRDDRGNPNRMEIVINGLIVESRQCAATLRGLLSELRQSLAGRKDKPASGGGKEASGAATGVTSLTARIAAKRSTMPAG